nr:MAG TPA: hypothetical protein [Bacteriophage sp.]DAV96490.1 MAG TPA: hypothetical protein [Caudoviricetes sp.]DAW65959.1 MAG TPA: hypothetical protein [Bacteriophage sp.]
MVNALLSHLYWWNECIGYVPITPAMENFVG